MDDRWTLSLNNGGAKLSNTTVAMQRSSCDKIRNNKLHAANEEVIMSIDHNVSLINQSGEKHIGDAPDHNECNGNY